MAADTPTSEAATAPDLPTPNVRGTSFVRGASLGRYLVLDRLGAGGMGVVYAAYDPELDRRVAVKVLLREGASDPRGRLRREAQTLARLSDPNVVRVHDVGTHDGHVFVAMELVDGVTLRSWLRDGPRPWREVLDRFLHAGSGLAAAHEAGIVHRDFKPENVLVRKDGHVFVTDFGLARLGADPLAPVSGDPGSPPYDRVTQTGALVGTPAYMAPEQHQTGVADERSDQFAFCVALHEGLYGERPFSADDATSLSSTDALAIEVVSGRVRAPRRAGDVPARLRRILLRGLEVDPLARFPSMRALLAALSKDPGARRRRRMLAVAGALVVAASALAAGAAIRAPRAACAAAGEKLAGVWDGGIRAGLERAFSATGRPAAGRDVERVASGLDTYAARWTAMRRDACEATVVRHEQSAELLDLRVACLDRKLSAMSALTQALAGAPDAEAMGRADKAVEALPELGECADAEALRSKIPLPSVPWRRALAGSLERRLALVEAAHALGKMMEASLLVQPLIIEARLLAHPPILARTLSVAADSQHRNAEAALPLLRQAMTAAGDARDDRLLAELGARLIGTLGAPAQRPDEALALVPVVEAAIHRAGNTPALRALLRRSTAWTLDAKGDHAAAARDAAEALALTEQAYGTEDRHVITDLVALADFRRTEGKYPEARWALERAVTLIEKLDGPTAPRLILVLTESGNLSFVEGANADALAAYLRAYDLAKANLAPDDPMMGVVVNNVGIGYNNTNQPAQALVWFERALETRRRVLGPDHFIVGESLANVADAEAQLEHWDVAEAHFHEAIALFERVVPPANRSLRIALAGLGLMQIDRGRPADAVPNLDRALAVATQSYEPDHPAVARTRVHLALALIAVGQVARAKALAEAAVPILDAKLPDEGTRFRGRWVLARARAAAGDQRGAVALAREAAAGLAKDPGEARLGAEIAAWLAARR